MWHLLPQQQQRGARIPRPGEPPADAVAGREAQDHETADIQTSPTGEPAAGIDHPADPIDRRTGDNTPSAPRPHVDWDTIVEPERVADRDEEQGD